MLARPSAVPAASSSAADRLQVVAADDDPGARRLIAEAFAEVDPDLNLILARDGGEALEALSVEPLCARDLLITDWRMPRMGGAELIAAVRARPDLAQLPGIVLSGTLGPDDVAAAYRCGATSVLTKPEAFAELVQLLSRVVDGWGRARAQSRPAPTSAQAEVPPCFELERALGRGGTSTVYRAKWLPSGRPVALKLSHSDLTPHVLEAFLAEARLGLRRRHPGFPAVLASGRFRSRLWMAQEVADGPTLDAFAREPSWSGPRRVEALARVARLIDALHGEGRLHLDIKGSNLVLTRNGPVVVDLGLAMEIGERRPAERVRCTPCCAPPELIERAPLDARADVFQLGVLLFEVFGARGPWRGDSAPEVLEAIVRDPPAPFEPDPARVRGLDDCQRLELATLANLCLARSPDARPPSAGWLAAALEALLRP